MRRAIMIGILLVGSGCVRQPIQSSPSPALMTQTDSLAIAATVVGSLLKDSVLHDAVRRAIIRLDARIAENPRSDSLLYGDLFRVVTRLDSLAARSSVNPRKFVGLRVF